MYTKHMLVYIIYALQNSSKFIKKSKDRKKKKYSWLKEVDKNSGCYTKIKRNMQFVSKIKTHNSSY